MWCEASILNDEEEKNERVASLLNDEEENECVASLLNDEEEK